MKDSELGKIGIFLGFCSWVIFLGNGVFFTRNLYSWNQPLDLLNLILAVIAMMVSTMDLYENTKSIWGMTAIFISTIPVFLILYLFLVPLQPPP